MSDTSGYWGWAGAPEGDEFNNTQFLIEQQTMRARTVMVVKVIKVHGGGVGPPPTVDVQPMVNQIDSQGNQTPHSTIYGVPVVRNQGNQNAIINDPVVNDVGIMSIHDRDVSLVKQNGGAQSNPASNRRFDPSDGAYHGFQMKLTTPNNYINLNGGSINIVSPNAITLQAPQITLNGQVTLGGPQGSGVPAAKLGTIDTGGNADISNLATKVNVN